MPTEDFTSKISILVHIQAVDVMMNTIIPNQQEVELHQDTKKQLLKKSLLIQKKPDSNDERIKRNYRHLARKKAEYAISKSVA